MLEFETFKYNRDGPKRKDQITHQNIAELAMTNGYPKAI